MSSTPKECSICNEEYDDDARCPRIFNCFHTICSVCIDHMIENNIKECPFCRRNFRANSATEIAINRTAIELMKYIAFLEGTTDLTKKSSQREIAIDELKSKATEVSCFSLINCQEAETQIETIINEVINLQKDVKQENTKIENEVLPKIQNVISQNNKVAYELENTCRKLHNQLKEIKDKSKDLEEMKDVLERCGARTFKETGVVLDQVEEANAAVGEWMIHFKEMMGDAKESLEAHVQEVQKTKENIAFVSVVLSKDETGEEINPNRRLSDLSFREEPLHGHIRFETIRGLSSPVRYLLEHHKIFALQTMEDGRSRRSARLSITEDNKLLLHHLKEEFLPNNVFIIPYNDVTNLVDPSSRLTFLELSDSHSTLGKLYIRLHPDTQRARQFALLCTGETGPCYVKTNISWVGNKGDAAEYIRCGDYEKMDGQGGKELLPGVAQEKGGVFSRTWLAGTVEGLHVEAIAAQFEIQTRDCPENELHCTFGNVEEGLPVLLDAIAGHPNIKDVVISDAGLVLPL